jgi:hypothetical protein
MIATSAILPSGQCTVYTQFPTTDAKLALGWFNMLIQFFIPLVLIIIFYVKMATVLHSRVEAAEPSVPGLYMITSPCYCGVSFNWSVKNMYIDY